VYVNSKFSVGVAAEQIRCDAPVRRCCFDHQVGERAGVKILTVEAFGEEINMTFSRQPNTVCGPICQKEN
jgi:hypothetical protein